MSSVLLMEWNEKGPSLWDLENLFMYGARVTENPKKIHPIVGDQGMISESFYSTGGDGGSGISVSDFGDGSSKSSKSASVNSSVGESNKSNFNLHAFEGFPVGFVDKKESTKDEGMGSSPAEEVSAGSAEPFLSLKLGKRMYFEDVCAGNNPKTSSLSVVSTQMETKAKRFKSTGKSICATRCQVEGCNIDLSSAKDYHRKHRICEDHSKFPKVIVDGKELRFCQQCSRFHCLSEFDLNKRSCRRRLSDHNARRRKPQPRAIRNPARLCSSLFSTDRRQHLNLTLDQDPCIYTRNASNITWDDTSSFKLTETKDYFPKSAKGGSARQINFLNNELPSSMPMLYHDSSKSSSKAIAAEVVNRGAEQSMISFNQDSTQDIHHRALSLLSNSSWVPSEAKPVSLENMHHSHSYHSMPQLATRAMTSGLPVSSEYWQNGHSPLDIQAHVSHAHGNGSNHFQELHQFRGPYEFGYPANHFN